MVLGSIQMSSGEIFEGEKIGELTEFFVNKFADEGLSLEKAKIVLNRVEETICECCVIQRLERR